MGYCRVVEEEAGLELLGKTYDAALGEALKLGVESVAVPCISANIFRAPRVPASLAAARALRRFFTGPANHARVTLQYATFAFLSIALPFIA